METFSRINVWIGILYLCFAANSFPLLLEESNIDLMREDVKCVSSCGRFSHFWTSPVADTISCLQPKQEPKSKFYTPANVRVRTVRNSNQADLWLSSAQPQGSLVQEMSSRVSMFHPVSLTCYMSASRRLKPSSPFFPQPDCVIVALECVAAELRTVRHDCADPEEVIDQAEEFLTDTIQRLKIKVSVPDRLRENWTGYRSWQPPSPTSSQESNSTACICESWPEKPFTDFLDAIQSLLEEVQSGASASAEVSWGPRDGSRSAGECQRAPSSSVHVTHFLPHQRRREWMYLNTAGNYLMTSIIQENLILLHFCNATFMSTS